MGDGSSTPTGQDPSEFDDKASPTATQASITSGSSSSSSSGGSSSSSVTSSDVAELEAHADNLTDSVNEDGSLSQFSSPSPAEFASQAFVDGVQARRIEAGFDGHAATPVDPSSDVVGGWHAFDTADIEDSVFLDQAVDTTGRTSQFMHEVTLSDRPDRAAAKAYATDYGHNSNYRHAPKMENAHSQMACYSALDAMGVEAPRHAFDRSSKHVYAESVPKPGYDAEIAENVSSEYANRVDPDQMKDIMAANIIVGNGDLKGDNLFVGEDGRVIPFDFDWTDTHGSLALTEAQYSRWINDGINCIDKARDEPLGFDVSDVVDRAEELATQLDESGMVDRVVSAAEQYDEMFRNENRSEYGPRSGRIDPVGDRIQKHVTNWSQSSDETIL